MGNKSRGNFLFTKKEVILDLFQDLLFGFLSLLFSSYHKGVVFVFFFVKMQTLSIGCTRMCVLYKNVYKRPFCSNIKKSKKEEV